MIDVTVLEKAIIFAINAHKGVKRQGDKRPYIMHPMSVMNRIYNAKKSQNMFLLAAAAILHDTVEDVEWITHDIIYNEFGAAVASLVKELTLDKEMYKIMGKKEYLVQEMNKMSSYALAIKLCDRIDNVSDLKSLKYDRIVRYLDETEYILNNLNRKLSPTHKKLIKELWSIIKKMRKFVEKMKVDVVA